MKTYNLKLSTGSFDLSVTDQLNTPIKDVETLKYAVDVFSKSGSFYFKVEVKQTASPNSNLITSTVQTFFHLFLSQGLQHHMYCIIIFNFQTIRNYLIENEQTPIITENEKFGKLSESSRIKLVKNLCQFMYSKFGPYPSTKQKEKVSMATINLFPCLKYILSKEKGFVRVHCRFAIWNKLCFDLFFHSF